MPREICLPPSPGYTHVAMRAIRRIVLPVDMFLHLQREFFIAIFQEKPPNRIGVVADFLEFHGLDTGDIIDIGHSEFDVGARCLVQPTTVIMYWYDEERMELLRPEDAVDPPQLRRPRSSQAN